MAQILVVDDEASIRALLRTFLSRLGHEVLEAGDTREGMRCFADAQPDLVITDMVMPEESGVELLRAIKKQDTRTPVIILTGKPTVEAAVECLKCGATDFLLKPLDLSHLQDRIDDILAGHLDASESEGDSVADECSELLPGFRIRRILGVGTSSTVYLADMESGSRQIPVALKILKMDNVFDDESGRSLSTRFTREAEVISRLEHPNIVKIYTYEVDTFTHIPYMALEYVSGRSMKSQLDRLQKENWQIRGRIIRQILDAVHTIHEHGICHRDIKPHNILLSDDLTVKLTDFGIVRLPDSNLTLPYQLFGTPLYMAPEAYDSAELGPQADLFSLGVVCYELCTGIQPFDGETYTEIARNVRNRLPVDPEVLVPSLPPVLRELIAWLMQKDPAQRCPDAATAYAYLSAWLDGDAAAAPLSVEQHSETWRDPRDETTRLKARK